MSFDLKLGILAIIIWLAGMALIMSGASWVSLNLYPTLDAYPWITAAAVGLGSCFTGLIALGYFWLAWAHGVSQSF